MAATRGSIGTVVATIGILVALSGCGRAAAPTEWAVRSGPDLLAVTLIDHLSLVGSLGDVERVVRPLDREAALAATPGPAVDRLRLAWWSGSCQTRPTITIAGSGLGTLVTLDPGPFGCGTDIAEPRSIELLLARPLSSAMIRLEAVARPAPG